LSGTFTLAANFATAGFDSRLTLTGKAIDATGTTTFAPIDTHGTIASNSLSAVSGPMTINGTFFGPKAEEVGASFNYRNDTVEMNGALVGKR
jgi:hypothetical protein